MASVIADLRPTANLQATVSQRVLCPCYDCNHLLQNGFIFQQKPVV